MVGPRSDRGCFTSHAEFFVVLRFHISAVPRFHVSYASNYTMNLKSISFPGWAAVRNMKKKKILKFWRAEHAETEERCQGHSLAATRIPSFQPLKWNSCCCRPGRSFKEVVVTRAVILKNELNFAQQMLHGSARFNQNFNAEHGRVYTNDVLIKKVESSRT